MPGPEPDLVALRDMDVLVRYGKKRIWPIADALGVFLRPYQERRYAWALQQCSRKERNLS